MLRNIIASVLFVFAASALNAQTATALPKDAGTLRKYQEARQRALQPLELKYRTELEKLLATRTKAGHLDDAIAIRKELDSLTQSSKSDTSATPDDSNSPVLTSGDWHWTTGVYDKPTQFLADSTWQNAWFKGSWEIKGRKLHLKYTNSDGKKFESTLERNRTNGSFSGKDGLGGDMTLLPPTQK